MNDAAIRTALESLDHADDDHWTSDGQPRVDVVMDIVGAPVTRKEIINAAPDFQRDGDMTPPPEDGPDEPEEPQPEDEPETAAPAVVDRDPVEERRPDLTPQQARYVEVSERLADINAEIGKLELERARLGSEQAILSAHNPDKPKTARDDQISRMDYIAAQNKARAEKADLLRTRSLMLTGGKAPIDAAMTRSTQRGTKRPNRAPMPRG